ncbi:MAG: copper amine oxidase N-terminal domain-containing protein [Vulcanimicrobiaceae bacterium]|jgi:hypothetical protein
MPSSTTRTLIALGAATALIGSAVPALAQDGSPVSVTVNGQSVQLNPPPTERAGRVFVPLRGVFENLGATVVYANGEINATDHHHTVSLHIGSTDAVVDGQPQTLDVAPFIVGASTYVPLRFISQALGAHVDYNGQDRTVSIAMGGGPPAETIPAQPQRQPVPAPEVNPNVSPVRLVNELPHADETVHSERPSVQASFTDGDVDPDAVKVFFDGRNVTANAYISGHGITYTPPSDIPSGLHEVRVVGMDRAGARFERGWNFTTNDRPVSVAPRPIEIVGVWPAANQDVPGVFRIRGRTEPGATVTIEVAMTPPEHEQDFLQARGALGANDSMQNTVTAGPDGTFESPIDSGAPPGTLLGIQIRATDPDGRNADPIRYVVHVQ